MTYQKKLYLIFRVRGSCRVISVLLSIYIAPGSTIGLLINVLDFQSNLQSFWTELLSKGLGGWGGGGDGQGVRRLESLTLEHVLVIPAEGGPWAQKSAALCSPVKHSPWVACMPSVRRATSGTRGTERSWDTYGYPGQHRGLCFAPLWHWPSPWGSPPLPLSGALRTSVFSGNLSLGFPAPRGSWLGPFPFSWDWSQTPTAEDKQGTDPGEPPRTTTTGPAAQVASLPLTRSLQSRGRGGSRQGKARGGGPVRPGVSVKRGSPSSHWARGGCL